MKMIPSACSPAFLKVSVKAGWPASNISMPFYPKQLHSNNHRSNNDQPQCRKNGTAGVGMVDEPGNINKLTSFFFVSGVQI